MMRLRLVKLVVQPVLVIDDGDTLEEVVASALTVGAAELDSLPEQIRRGIADAGAKLAAEREAALDETPRGLGEGDADRTDDESVDNRV